MSFPGAGPTRQAGLLNVLMRIAMIYAYLYGGKSLFAALAFHAMINVSTGIFPNYGSHMNTWIFSVWMAVMLLLVIYFTKRKRNASYIEKSGG